MTSKQNNGWVGSWSPGIGDPSVIGWVTVIAYFVVAWLCFRNMRLVRQQGGVADGKLCSVWRMLAVLLVLLGINKQLDLQTALTEIGRMVAHAMGWYGNRRLVQTVFVGIVGAAAFGCVLWILKRGCHSFARMAITGVGVCGLFAFVLIRAISFHHVDQLLGLKLFGARVNWLFELGSLVVIACGAVRYAATCPRSVP